MRYKKVKSVGGVLFLEDETKIKYLLLKHKKTGTHWGFPKGRMQERETEEETAIREIKEETGISDFKIIKDFKITEKYFFFKENVRINKEVVYFLTKVNFSDILLSTEHSDYCWEEYKEALEKLEHKETQEVLIKSNNFLTKK